MPFFRDLRHYRYADAAIHDREAGTVPTRAEVTDIFQAVQDGSNAVMLSGESSVGKHPVQSVKVLMKVSHYAEQLGTAPAYTFYDLLSRI